MFIIKLFLKILKGTICQDALAIVMILIDNFLSIYLSRHMKNRRRSIPCRRYSMYKGPEVGKIFDLFEEGKKRQWSWRKGNEGSRGMR